MAELLLEIFSEEIPARMQARAAEDLSRLVGDSLKAQGLEATSLRAVGGSRRLTLIADGLPKAQPDTTEERKGPQVGAPEQALQGFMKAAGITSIDQAEVRELPKGKFYFSVVSKKGRPTAVVLKEIVEGALAQLPWPKSMRWGTNPTRWVRPLHRIICLFDGAVVPVAYAGVTAGDTTVGHRFLAPAEIKVNNAGDYIAKLRAAHVIVEPAERETIITRDLDKLAAAEGLTVVAGAVFLKARITGDLVNRGLIGPVPVGRTPRIVRLNTEYGPASWLGVSVDAQLENLSSRVASVDNRAVIPARTTLSLGGRYRFKLFNAPAMLRVQVQNVTDVFGWDINAMQLAFEPAEPRRVTTSLAVDF